eukprot:1139367-Pelagomonas_calceolata.AAC.6
MSVSFTVLRCLPPAALIDGSEQAHRSAASSREITEDLRAFVEEEEIDGKISNRGVLAPHMWRPDGTKGVCECYQADRDHYLQVGARHQCCCSKHAQDNARHKMHVPTAVLHQCARGANKCLLFHEN